MEKKAAELSNFENSAFTGTLRLKTERTVYKCYTVNLFLTGVQVSNYETILYDTRV